MDASKGKAMECLIMGRSGVGYHHMYKHTLLQMTVRGVERQLLKHIRGVGSYSTKQQPHSPRGRPKCQDKKRYRVMERCNSETGGGDTA